MQLRYAEQRLWVWLLQLLWRRNLPQLWKGRRIRSQRNGWTYYILYVRCFFLGLDLNEIIYPQLGQPQRRSPRTRSLWNLALRVHWHQKVLPLAKRLVTFWRDLMLSMEVGFQNIVQTIYTFQNPNKHQHIWSGGGGSTAVASCPSPMEGVTGPSHKPSGGGGCEFQKYFGHVESAIGFRFVCVIRQWRTNANIGGIRFCPHGGSAWHLTHVYYLVIPWCFGFHSSASVHLGLNFHTRTHTYYIYTYT